MRIVLVTFRFPYPLFGGGSSRAFYHVAELRRRGHKVRLVTPPPPRDAREEAEDEVLPMFEQVEYYETGGWRRVTQTMAAPLRPEPIQTTMQWGRAGRRALAAALADGEVDVLQTQLIRTAPAVHSAPRSVGRVLDLVDALSLNLSRRAAEERGMMRRIVEHEAERVRRYERAIIREYDEVVITSPADRDVIDSDAGIEVVPMGVDTPTEPRSEELARENLVVFTGAMWYFPNENAVQWFATEVWPRVRAEVPDARFLIVGDRPTPAVQRLQTIPGITVTGHVADVTELLRTAAVAVAPMRAGSGMQTKVLAAMGNDVPVVATSYVLGGVPATAGEHLLVADEPNEFADALVGLLRDRSARRRLADAARCFVKDHYSWSHSVDLLERVYERARSAAARRIVDSRSLRPMTRLSED